jgi:hypothetical protein
VRRHAAGRARAVRAVFVRRRRHAAALRWAALGRPSFPTTCWKALAGGGASPRATAARPRAPRPAWRSVPRLAIRARRGYDATGASLSRAGVPHHLPPVRGAAGIRGACGCS